jgi:hypothetical protein
MFNLIWTKSLDPGKCRLFLPRSKSLKCVPRSWITNTAYAGGCPALLETIKARAPIMDYKTKSLDPSKCHLFLPCSKSLKCVPRSWITNTAYSGICPALLETIKARTPIMDYK